MENKVRVKVLGVEHRLSEYMPEIGVLHVVKYLNRTTWRGDRVELWWCDATDNLDALRQFLAANPRFELIGDDDE